MNSVTQQTSSSFFNVLKELVLHLLFGLIVTTSLMMLSLWCAGLFLLAIAAKALSSLRRGMKSLMPGCTRSTSKRSLSSVSTSGGLKTLVMSLFRSSRRSSEPTPKSQTSEYETTPLVSSSNGIISEFLTAYGMSHSQQWGDSPSTSEQWMSSTMNETTPPTYSKSTPPPDLKDKQ